MTHHTETLISVAVVAIAIALSLYTDEKEIELTTDTTTPIETPAPPEPEAPIFAPQPSPLPSLLSSVDIIPLTSEMSQEEKKAQCIKNEQRASELIKNSLALIENLNAEDSDEQQKIKHHFQQISYAKQRIDECQSLLQDYDEEIRSLESKINQLQLQRQPISE